MKKTKMVRAAYCLVVAAGAFVFLSIAASPAKAQPSPVAGAAEIAKMVFSATAPQRILSRELLMLVAAAKHARTAVMQAQEQPPAAESPKPAESPRSEAPGGTKGTTAWYQNPMWIAIISLAAVIVLVLIIMALRGSDPSSTTVISESTTRNSP